MKKIIVLLSLLFFVVASGILYHYKSEKRAESSSTISQIVEDEAGTPQQININAENETAQTEQLTPKLIISESDTPQKTQTINETTDQISEPETLVYTTGVFGIKIPYPKTYSYSGGKQATSLGDGEVFTFGFPGNLEKITIYPVTTIPGDNEMTCQQMASNNSHSILNINGQTVYHRTIPTGDEDFCLRNSSYSFRLSRKTTNTEKIDVQSIFFPESSSQAVCEMKTYSKTFGGALNKHISVQYTENLDFEENNYGTGVNIIFGKPSPQGGLLSGTKSGIILSNNQEPKITKSNGSNCYSGYVDWSTLEIR